MKFGCVKVLDDDSSVDLYGVPKANPGMIIEGL